MLKVTRTDPKRVRYGNLRGSGLIPRPDPYCMLDSCKPTPNPTPTSPVPQPIDRPAPEPLCATKLGPDTNKWELNGIRYPNFNSLWVNIPRQRFARLKVNGRNN